MSKRVTVVRGSQRLGRGFAAGYKGKTLSKREKRQVKRLISNKLEYKYLDTVLTTFNIPYGGYCYSICDVSQGDSDSTRSGDEIRLAAISIRYTWTAAATASYNNVRFIVFQYKQNDNPTGATVLQGTGTILAPMQFYRWDYKQIVHVLYDQTHTLVGSSSNYVINRKINVRKFAKKIQYNAGSTTATNKVYILVISDDSVTPYPQVSFVARIKYTDA